MKVLGPLRSLEGMVLKHRVQAVWEDISIEDLVGRQTISVDYQGIGEFIRGKAVLVTGAGGAIGAEIVVQICAFGPEELIRIHGMAPYKDIDIEFTGLRPGEKLFEEILTAEEGTDASRHEKIFIARNDAKFTLPELPAILDEFNAIISDPSPDSHAQMKSLLRKYVKYYQDTAMSAEC